MLNFCIENFPTFKGGFALTALNVNHDFLQVSQNLNNFLKHLKFFPHLQLTVFYRGFLGRKLLIQVLT